MAFARLPSAPGSWRSKSCGRTRPTWPFRICDRLIWTCCCNGILISTWDNRCMIALRNVGLVLVLLPFSVAAQTSDTPAPDPPENWNLYYQATSIGQRHGTFNSPYEGPLSLQDYPESDVSITTTMFFGFRLGPGTQFYFNPEIAG